MSTINLWFQPLSVRLSRSPCRWVMVLTFLWTPGSSLGSAEEIPAENRPAPHAFDRFDRIILQYKGKSAHVELKRRHAERQKDEVDPSDAKDLVEVRFSPGVFESFVFGSDDEDAVRRRLESALMSRVTFLVRMFKLDEAREKKLLQAGRGDLQRLHERISDLKKGFTEPDLIDDDHLIAVKAWASKRLDEAIVLRHSLASTSSFREGSMLDKVLRRQLTPEQIVDYDEHERRVRTGVTRDRQKARPAF